MRVDEINNMVRGLSPYPAAFTMLKDKKVKIFACSVEICAHEEPAGRYSSDGKNYLKFAAADGFVNITDLQLEGKKRMNVEDFLRGWRITD